MAALSLLTVISPEKTHSPSWPEKRTGLHMPIPWWYIFKAYRRDNLRLNLQWPIMISYLTEYTSSLEYTPKKMASEIIAYISGLPEGKPVSAGALSYLGSAEAVSEALSELTHIGKLNEICEGVYVQPVETRFGTRSPDAGMVISQLAELWEETIVPSGGAAANLLGMTTQVPMVPVYLTSGEDRTLHLGEATIKLRHAQDWQLLEPNQPVGNAVRALAWMGPEEIEQSIESLGQVLSVEDLKELALSCSTMPEWITSSLTSMASGA